MSRRPDGNCEGCGERPPTKVASITDMDGTLEELAELCDECVKPIARCIP